MKQLSKVLIILVVLMCIGRVALAQNDGPVLPDDPALPGWAEQLTFGTVTLSAFVWAATEITKRLLAMLGIFQPGWGRFLVVGWAIIMVGVAIAGEMLQFNVAPVVEWVYQALLLILTLIGAPIAHQVAKRTGFTP